jgi:hypothetical protein
MKKALIGISNKIKQNKDKIKIWKKSFEKFCDGDVILIAANADAEDIRVCEEELKIQYHKVDVGYPWYINNKRLHYISEYIKNSDIDLFLATDVFDVIFQGDPFTKFDLINYDLFVSNEGIMLREEPWNTDVINKCFPGEISCCINNEITCSGVIGGKKEQIIHLFDRMYKMTEEAENGHNVRDQAALILMMAKNQIERLQIFNIDDGLAMHCATSGPTQFFEGWGLKRNLSSRYGIPKLVGNKIYTADDKVYDIVHQFNRIPEWHQILISDYE